MHYLVETASSHHSFTTTIGHDITFNSCFYIFVDEFSSFVLFLFNNARRRNAHFYELMIFSHSCAFVSAANCENFRSNVSSWIKREKQWARKGRNYVKWRS